MKSAASKRRRWRSRWSRTVPANRKPSPNSSTSLGCEVSTSCGASSPRTCGTQYLQGSRPQVRERNWRGYSGGRGAQHHDEQEQQRTPQPPQVRCALNVQHHIGGVSTSAWYNGPLLPQRWSIALVIQRTVESRQRSAKQRHGARVGTAHGRQPPHRRLHIDGVHTDTDTQTHQA